MLVWIPIILLIAAGIVAYIAINYGVTIPWKSVWRTTRWAVPTLVVLGFIGWGMWALAHARPGGGGSGKKTPSFPALPKPVDLAPVLAKVRASLEVFGELPKSMEVTYPAVTDTTKSPTIQTDVSLVGLGSGHVSVRWRKGQYARCFFSRMVFRSATQWHEIGLDTTFLIEEPEATVASLKAEYSRPFGEEVIAIEPHFPPGYEGLRTLKQAGDGEGLLWVWGKLPPRTMPWTCSMCLRNADGSLLTGKLPPVWTVDRLAGQGKLTKKIYPWPANGILHLQSTDVPVGQDFLILSTDGPWKMFVTLKLKK